MKALQFVGFREIALEQYLAYKRFSIANIRFIYFVLKEVIWGIFLILKWFFKSPRIYRQISPHEFEEVSILREQNFR